MQWRVRCAPRVIVAAEDVATRRAVDELLSDEGYDVISARDVSRTLALARALAPGLVLVDADLAGGGAEALISGLDPNIRVGVLTGQLPLDAARRAADLGAAAFFNRPLNLSRLLRIARKLVVSTGVA